MLLQVRPLPAAPSATRASAWRLASLGALALVLASCGGGHDSPSTGTVFPPVQGLVMVEYDADGREIQRSSATDENGRFTFAHVMSGHRIESTQPGLRWEAATTRSALIESPTDVQYVTPLTTLLDQWVMSGVPEDEARVASADMLHRACGEVVTPDAAARSMNGTEELALTMHPVAFALAAYLNALRDTGVDPVAGRTFWRQLFVQFSDVLAASCDAARQIHSRAWMDATLAHVAAFEPSITGDALEWLTEVRQSASEQVLRLVAGRLAQARYPQIAAVTALGPAWAESPMQKSLELAAAAIDSRLDSSAVGSAPDSRSVAFRFVLNRFGQVVSSMEGATLQDHERATVQLTNSDVVDRSVRLSLNGATLGGFGTLLAEVLAFPQSTPDQSLQERVWRWVVSRHRHQYPLTEGPMIHQPDLYFRSLGFGFCDDAASAMYRIWRNLGFESRVWALNGHVVAEVQEGGRWVIYDADLQLYYNMRNGRKAGLQDLVDDPSLITNPVSPLLKRSNGAYSAALASIYTSQDDNAVSEAYSAPIANPLRPEFVLPPGARLEVERDAADAVPTIDPSTELRQPTLRLWLPPGYVGVVSIPLVLLNITGQGTVRILDHEVEAEGEGARPVINAYYRDAASSQTAISRVEVTRVGDTGLSLQMSVNPYYYERRKQLEVGFLSGEPRAFTIGIVGPNPSR